MVFPSRARCLVGEDRTPARKQTEEKQLQMVEGTDRKDLGRRVVWGLSGLMTFQVNGGGEGRHQQGREKCREACWAVCTIFIGTFTLN